jgi:hypothetical protein
MPVLDMAMDLVSRELQGGEFSFRHGGSFERSLLAGELLVTVLEFERSDAGRGQRKIFRIALDVDEEFREHYRQASVSIRKELRYPILD